MKRINETFTNSEFEILKQIKTESGFGWHDFIINAANHYIKKDDTQCTTTQI